jgi:type I restriction enzyme M protein
MKTRFRKAANQRKLFDSDAPVGGVASISDTFRKLYYHLYTNSQASRAERIISDLSLLLLLKLTIEMNGAREVLDRFLAGTATSQESLLPLLRDSFPGLIESSDKFGMGDSALRESFAILENVRLSDSPAHVLGDAFQALIGPRLRGDKGQFFTPRSLVRVMVNVVAPKPHESVLDPACGTGGFLAEAHQFQLEQGQPTGRLVGIDKDHDLFRIASALLTVTCGKRAYLQNLNSLDPLNPQLMGNPASQFDVVLTNPPFGTKIGVRDKDVLRAYDLAYQWVECSKENRWRRTDILSSTQDPQILFLELCVRCIKPGGRMGIVLPEGVFGNKRTAFIWQWLRSQGKITALLDCPRTTFQPGTDTKTNVLFFEREGNAPARELKGQQVRVAVAIHCGHDRRGRTHYADNSAYPDDFAELTKRGTAGWREVTIRQADYWVPRYYVERELTREEESLVDGAKFVALGELRDRRVLSIRKGHEVGSHAYGTGDISFVRTSDVNNFEVSVDPTKSVSEIVYREYAQQQKLKPGDVLMVVDGRYRIGATALLTESNHRCVVQSHFRIISVADSSVIDPYELMFALNLSSVKIQLRNLVFIQSTLGTLGNRLLELEIPLLHGKGPWSDRVNSFRELLRKRDESLAVLRKMSGSEPEL